MDFITDRKPIRDLLGFADGELTAFKFGVTIIGNTTLLTRLGNNTHEIPKKQGFRAGFESDIDTGASDTCEIWQMSLPDRIQVGKILDLADSEPYHRFHYHDQHFKPHTAKFEDIRVEEVGGMINEWENANASTLRKLVDVLGDIIQAAKEVNGPCVVSYKGIGAGSLSVSAGEVPSLPTNMQSLFQQSADMEVDTPMEGIKTEGSIKEEVTEDKDAIMA
ncbi:hypothetical protein OEA41_009817 [Lepraria neglecta]|uniref:Uncharacterized protein n=1 Tax=Lepraria neglecta TaxID=209136 RepID=A0AAE0DD88_9LECA|nr:hypothetical protein OEA41_009817 [Lepraria neglecta]